MDALVGFGPVGALVGQVEALGEQLVEVLVAQRERHAVGGGEALHGAGERGVGELRVLRGQVAAQRGAEDDRRFGKCFGMLPA